MPDSGNHLSAAEKLKQIKKLYRQHKMSYKEFRLRGWGSQGLWKPQFTTKQNRSE